MTLEARDKLMSLTDVSECWAYPSTPCTAGGIRATAQSATEWAVTYGTVGRPSRLGWNSTSTNASNRGAGKSFSSLLAARVACLAAHVDLSGRVGV
jgi:hypothetical protein